jgi:signal transduction histidine kinase
LRPRDVRDDRISGSAEGARFAVGSAEPRPVMGYRTLRASTFPIVVTACLATVALVAVSVLRTSGDAPKLAVVVLIAGAAVVLGVGLTDLARARDLRFAGALIAAGLLWSVSALAASSEPAVYSVGRVCQWLVELAIVYLLLTYPSGRLTDRTDRALLVGGALLVALLYLPTALVVQHFPSPSPWSVCTSGCPPNALALGSSSPGFVHNLLIPAREALSVGLFLAVFVVLRARGRAAGPLVRRLYGPIALIALLRVLTLALYFVTRRIDAMSWALPLVSWAFVLSLPALALACAAGRMYPRLFAASALDRIARSLGSSATPAHVSQVLARTLEDPSLRILHSFPGDSGAWVSESGSPAVLPQATAGRQLTEVSTGNWRIAVVHSPTLAEDPTLVRTAGFYALAALENYSLTDELRRSLHDLAESRERRLTAEQSERQKIERDLHDGAQQRLVALRLKVALAADALNVEDPAGAKLIYALEDDVDAAIEEVRSFARGVYPAVLARTGLEQALRSVSRIAPLPSTVRADGVRRYAPTIEATVYFSCSEALQNACKHARGATGVTISVWEDTDLHFEVRDDGEGFDLQTVPYGTGLTNLSDRLAALGGSVEIRSAPGCGTVLEGSIPLA